MQDDGLLQALQGQAVPHSWLVHVKSSMSRDGSRSDVTDARQL